MTAHLESILEAFGQFLKSKINAGISLAVASGVVVAEASEPPVLYIGDSLNVPFLMKVIGTVFIVMQILNMIYRFIKWSTEVIQDAKRKKTKTKQRLPRSQHW